jgi:hypothetical protein
MQSSFFIRLANKSAAEKFFSGQHVKEIIHAVIAEEQARIERLNILYDYPDLLLNVEQHLKKSNLKDAINSYGCGCKLCSTRFNYTTAKMNIRWFNNCYFNDNKHYLFEEMFVREADSFGPEAQTKEGFYNVKLAEYERFAKIMHNNYTENKKIFVSLNIKL